MQPQVHSSGSTSARIAIVGEAPGEREVQQGKPFVGPSGHLLDEMLKAAGVARAACFVTNVCRQRPPGNDIDAFFDKAEDSERILGKDCRPPIVEGLKALYRELRLVQPTIVIACGNTALWALTGLWGVTKWRGSVLEATPEVAQILGYTPKLVPTFHPANVLRTWERKNVVLNDLRRAVKESAYPEVRRPEYRFTTAPSVQYLANYFTTLWQMLAEHRTPLSVDIETIAGHIECIGLATSRTEALCIPFLHDRGEQYFTLEQETWVLQWLQAVLTHPNCVAIGQNFNYDAQYIARRWGFVPNLRHDTMIMQNVAFPGTPKTLDYLSSLYQEHYVYWKDDLKDYRELPDDDEVFWRYSCIDVVATYEVAEVLLRTIDQFGLREVYDFQMRLWWPVLWMTLRGIRIDVRRKEAIRRELYDEAAALAQWLDYVVPEDVLPRPPKAKPWYNSAQQKAELFYNVLGVQAIMRDRKGKQGYTRTPTTDDDALETIAKREPLLKPICDALLRRSEIAALERNFIDAHVDDDGRIRGSIDIAGTETFRFAHRKNAFGGGSNLGNLKRMTKD